MNDRLDADHQARMEQAGAYLREVSQIVMQIYEVLTDPDRWERPMPAHLAAGVAESLVATAMAMGGYE
ncbi:MAG: hypothetical protein GTO41_28885 [Burkholderiales bacterium]|nr:hypothetical protein [Burkholderiales bacterium]